MNRQYTKTSLGAHGDGASCCQDSFEKGHESQREYDLQTMVSKAEVGIAYEEGWENGNELALMGIVGPTAEGPSSSGREFWVYCSDPIDDWIGWTECEELQDPSEDDYLDGMRRLAEVWFSKLDIGWEGDGHWRYTAIPGWYNRGPVVVAVKQGNNGQTYLISDGDISYLDVDYLGDAEHYVENVGQGWVTV